MRPPCTFVSERASVHSEHSCVSLFLFLSVPVWIRVSVCGCCLCLWVAPCCSDRKRKTKIQVLGKAEFAERFFFRLPFFQKTFRMHCNNVTVTAVFCREMEVSRPNSVPREVPLFLVCTNLFFFYYTCYFTVGLTELCCTSCLLRASYM